MSKGKTALSSPSQRVVDSQEAPSLFLHEIGPGFTPVITSHKDVNFFEKSFEKAMSPTEGSANSKLPPLKGVPALNSKLKLNSIQLISPPSDTSATFGRSPDYDGLQGFPRKPSLGTQVHVVGRAPFESHTTNFSQPPSGPTQMIRSTFDQAPYAVPGNPIITQIIPEGPSGVPIMSRPAAGTMPLEPSGNIWAASLQQAKASSIEKQMRFQEKNRLAAMKSRQRKKQEWERLQDSEKELMDENRSLKERIAVLEGELRALRESMPGCPT